MLAMETIVPVYFAVEDEALLSIYEQTQAASASQGSASAAEGGPGAAGVEWVRGEPSLSRARSLHATSETLNTSPISPVWMPGPAPPVCRSRSAVGPAHGTCPGRSAAFSGCRKPISSFQGLGMPWGTGGRGGLPWEVGQHRYSKKCSR